MGRLADLIQRQFHNRVILRGVALRYKLSI